VLLENRRIDDDDDHQSIKQSVNQSINPTARTCNATTQGTNMASMQIVVGEAWRGGGGGERGGAC
jgi:hypothetical protein